MDSMKKTKQHKLTDKHPVISALLMVFGGFVIYALAESFFSGFCGGFSADYGKSVAKLITAGILLLILLVYKHHFKPEYEGSLSGGDIKKGFLLILIQCSYTLIVQIIRLFDNNIFHIPGITITCSALEAGVAEEVIYRGLAVTTMMRVWKNNDNRMIAAALISSAAFSITHLMNLIAGAPLSMTVIQVICTLSAGIFYAAVYMRTGNLIPLIAGHFFHDIMQYVISAPDSAESLILTGNVTWSGWVDLTMTIVLGCIGLWLLRKEKRPEVTEIWNKKWKCISE